MATAADTRQESAAATTANSGTAIPTDAAGERVGAR